MKDGRVMGMAADKEMQRIEDRSSGGFKTNYNWFRMLPKEDGEKADNRLYCGLFKPSSFTHLGDCIPKDLYTYYLRVPLHYLYDPIEGRDIPIVCIDGLNEVIKTSIPGSVGVPFPEQVCKYCAMEKGWWKKANERREALGGKQVPYETLTKDEDWMLKRNMARSFKPSDRYFFLVLDIDKLFGTKKMDEDEVLQMQLYNGSETIFKNLYQKVHLGYSFWNLDDPKILVIHRDNKNGAQRPDYVIEIDPRPLKLSDEVRELILTEEFYPDIMKELVIQTPEEQLEMLRAREDELSLIGVGGVEIPTKGISNTVAKETAGVKQLKSSGIKLRTQTQNPKVEESPKVETTVTNTGYEASSATTQTANGTEEPEKEVIKDSESLVEKLNRARRIKNAAVEVGGKQYRSF